MLPAIRRSGTPAGRSPKSVPMRVPPCQRMEMPIQSIVIWTPASLLRHGAMLCARGAFRLARVLTVNEEQAEGATGE